MEVSEEKFATSHYKYASFVETNMAELVLFFVALLPSCDSPSRAKEQNPVISIR
jgi:hypothetical protein